MKSVMTFRDSVKKCSTLAAISCIFAASAAAAGQAPVVKGDFRDFGISRADTVIWLDCGEIAADNRNPLFYADFRDNVEVAFDVRFSTFLTEQAALSKEASAGSREGALTVGYDPGSERVFAEVIDADGRPRRVVAGPKVTDAGRYAVRVRSALDHASAAEAPQSVLTLTVTPYGSPSDSVAPGNTAMMRFDGHAMQYVPGRWIVGHGYPGGFPNSLQLRKGEVGNLHISGRGLPHKDGANPLFADRFTADPAGIVVDGRLYMIVGEDRADVGGWFYMPHWVVYSTSDMEHWTCHGPVLKASDFPNASPNGAWAAQVVEKDGKFFFYVTLDDARDGKHMISVAVADDILGPYTPVDTPLVTDDLTPGSHRPNADIDPTVMIDDDGTAWMAWGNGDCYLTRLSADMTRREGDIMHLGVRNFSEGPWLFKRDGIYYLVYAADAPGVQPEQLAYSTARSLTGEWTYGGLLTGPARYGFTIHPSVNEFGGEWYLFYHDGRYMLDGAPGGDCRRRVCAERLYFNPDGSIRPVVLTEEGATAARK